MAPPEKPEPELSLRDFADYALIGLFALAVILALRTAAELFVPMIGAVLVGTILARLGDRVQRLGVPPYLGAIGLVTFTAAGIFFVGQALYSPVSAVIERLPDLAGRVVSWINRASVHLLPLNMQTHGRETQAPATGAGALGGGIDMGWVTGVFTGLTPALGELLIFLATLFFFVAGRTELRKRMVLASADRDRRLSVLRIINATEGALAHYFGTAAAVYAGVSTAAALIAWIAGLPTPYIWGVFAFVAGFIPFLGPALTTGALITAGLSIHDNAFAALLPAGAFLVVHLAAENAVLPSLIGRRLEINPFLVFVSIVFWTWMWGATGAVLAAPLLLVAITIRAELVDD